MIGTTLQQRYKIQRELGSGGYGVVYLAEDLALQRPVAIKRLHQPEQGGLIPARFEREAQAIAGLQHPHIIQLHDIFKEEGMLYQVMEYADAGSLEALLHQPAFSHGMPVEQVVEIGKALSSALTNLHRCGIVHRDIKPSNILFSSTPAGWVIKLADFGIAQAPDDDFNPTRSGDILGTLPYLSPEQLRGLKAQPASDVYALGIILYRLLAGQPYLSLDGPSTEQRRRILGDSPRPLAEIRPDVPAWLAGVVHQALRKDYRQRPTAAVFHRQLLAAGQPPQPQKARSRPAVRAGRPLSMLSMVRGYSLATLLLAILFSMGLSISGTLLLSHSFPARTLPLESPGTPLLEESSVAGRTQTPSPTLAPTTAPNPTATPYTGVPAVVHNTSPAEGLKLRASPTVDDDILAVLPEGTALLVLEYNGPEAWTWVDAGSEFGRGWVYGGYLRLTE